MQRDLNEVLGDSILDLGTVSDPMLVFGGPYSNRQATESMLDLAARRGVAKNRIICTGDVVAYCAEPQACVDLIRQAGIHVVMGNCEESLGFQFEDCGCGFTQDSACDTLSRQWFEYASKHLDASALAWMRGLPRHIVATMETPGKSRRFSFIHGSTTSLSGWIFASTPDEEKARHLGTLGSDVVIAGHSGLPFISPLDDGRVWANAGVIGMPANDGTTRGWFAMLEPQDNTFRLTTEAFGYAHVQSSTAMVAAGLADSYAQSLISGIWPNMDVLPQVERNRRGHELNSDFFVW